MAPAAFLAMVGAIAAVNNRTGAMLLNCNQAVPKIKQSGRIDVLVAVGASVPVSKVGRG